jgi:hypothetical protein
MPIKHFAPVPEGLLNFNRNVNILEICKPNLIFFILINKISIQKIKIDFFLPTVLECQFDFWFLPTTSYYTKEHFLLTAIVKQKQDFS